MKQVEDSWQSVSSYELFMGRWSKLVAREFLEWLPVSDHKLWLDVGCGTGVLSSVILSSKQPKEILAIDASAKFIDFAQRTVDDFKLRFKVALAQSLPTKSNYFDATVSGLALNFISQPEKAVAEMVRVTKPYGTVAAYVWDYSEGMQMLRYFWDAAIAVDASAKEIDEAVRFPLCHKRSLEQLFVAWGLQEVKLKAIIVPTVFTNFEDYWQPFLGRAGPAPSYVSTLQNEQLTLLKEHLQKHLPLSNDGSISLSALAWAVQGTVIKST